MLFVDEGGGRVTLMKESAGLFAFLGRAAADGSPASCVRWTDKSRGPSTKAEYFKDTQQTAERFDAVEKLPHEPQRPGAHYASRPHDAARGGDGVAFEKRGWAYLSPGCEPDGPRVQIDYDPTLPGCGWHRKREGPSEGGVEVDPGSRGSGGSSPP